MNVPIPRAPRRSSGQSVRAMARMTSPLVPLDTHALVPLKIQSSPSRTACVRSDAASEPASGSESANAPSISPRASGLSQRLSAHRFPSAESSASERVVDASMTAIDASTIAISSSTTR